MLAYLDLTIKVLAALLVVLAATAVCGRVALAIRQPRVVGEMVAGVLLGPSLLGAVSPSLQDLLFPDDVKGVLYVLSTIGLTYYMFLVGVTIDHRTMDRLTVQRSVTVAGAGIVLPFGLAAVVAVTFYGQLAVPGVSRFAFVLFLGGALSITAFPMLARILQERGISNTPFGSLTLLAGAINDAVAWGLLAIVVAIATASGASGALTTVLGAVIFSTVLLTIGRRVLAPFGRKVEREGGVSHGAVALILLSVVAAAWFTETIGIFAVFGGFILGMTMPSSSTLRRELQVRLMDFNLILLLPVFFAFSGLNTQLTGLNDVQLLLPLAAALVAACVGKYLGCALTARWHGIPWRQSWAIGGLMNARGLMILVFINVGLAHDLISPELFAMLVIVAVVTTATAMPLYQLHIPPHLEAALHHETRAGRPALSDGDPGALDGGDESGEGGDAGPRRTPEGVT